MIDINIHNAMLEIVHPIEAEFLDGFIVSEKSDTLFDGLINKNIYANIRLKKYEFEHGEMIRWSIYNYDQRIDIDWTKLPNNSIPLRLKQYSYSLGNSNSSINSIKFGFEYFDSNGKLIQELREVL